MRSSLWLHVKICQSGSAPDVQKLKKSTTRLSFCDPLLVTMTFSPPLPPLPGQPSAEPWGSAPGFFLFKRRGFFVCVRCVSLSWIQISAWSFIKPLDVHTMGQKSVSHAVITRQLTRGLFIYLFMCSTVWCEGASTELLFKFEGTVIL